jgi:FkbM family methyltransferase
MSNPIEGPTKRFILAIFFRFTLARRAYSALSEASFVAPFLRRFIRKAFPIGTRVWLRIRVGLGKGLWVHLDPRFETNYAEGNYEPSVESVIASHLRVGSIFYDVGAHIGILSMLAARMVGKEGAVIAFEADPENVKRIEEHARRNMLDRIRVVPCAVSRLKGIMRFERASESSSRNKGALTTGGVTASNGNSIEVEAISLDDFVAADSQPTLIKVDVEGAEADVLRGSEKIFALAKPILICEVHNHESEENVTQWLLQQNYSFEWIQQGSYFPRQLIAKYIGDRNLAPHGMEKTEV